MSGPEWFTDTVVWPTLDRQTGQPSFIRADLQAMPQVPTLREGRVGAAGPRNGTASHRPGPRSSFLFFAAATIIVLSRRRQR